MNDDMEEIMLDLLCKQAVYGLNDDEARQLEEFEVRAGELRSLELTAATISIINLKTDEPLPDHLQSKIAADADKYFAARKSSDRASETADAVPAREITFVKTTPRGSFWNWFGWAVAAAACVALAVNIYSTRSVNQISQNAGPTPAPEEKLTPAQERQRLINTPDNLFQAKWTGVKEYANIGGDVVWSDNRQEGYLRFQGLPINDPSKETYQLWIFDESQDPKTPIDGGTFDIVSGGEVIIPIDARLKARNPKMFAVTLEKPGGVVVSKQEKVAVIANVKPK